MGFNAGLSGIQAASSNLDVIGNNIANSATIGFKGSRAEFADIYNYGNYNSGTTTVGGGVRLSSVHQSFAAGNINPTTNSTDLAIRGTGFFVLNANGARVYSRAGQFVIDKQNYISNSSNQQLVGWLADKSGNITSTMGNLQINTAEISPHATNEAIVGLNLDSRSKPPSVDWAGGPSPAKGSYNDPCSYQIYDSLGNSHTLTMYFIAADPKALGGNPNASTPPGTENQWYVAIQIDNQDVPALPSPATNTNDLCTVTFNSDGSFASVNGPGGVALPNNLLPINYALNNGSQPLNMTIDLSNSTQFGSTFAEQKLYNDGYTTGSLAALDIDKSGIIRGTYTNGQSMVMGQIVLATFASPEGLQNLGNTTWTETVASGTPLINNGGTGSSILSANLEDSNVDITSELVKLIGAQRDFQANAQTIRTNDAVMQTIINNLR